MQQQETIPAVMALTDDDFIRSRILTVRSVQVLLDRDLALLYGVETKVLNQAVKRNIARFPDGFMFQLSHDEMENWKSQFVTSNLSDEDEAGLRMGLRRPLRDIPNFGIICDVSAGQVSRGDWPTNKERRSPK